VNFRRNSGSERIEFQLAPMIDIMFLLLSFFIASQIYAQWETEIDIKLPTSATGDQPDRAPAEIIVNVKVDGTLVVNQKVFDHEGFGALLQRVVKLYPGQPVLVRADRQTPYQYVVGVLDLCRSADIWNISFATSVEE
jgi:biopolymer transport protein ExbD